MSDDERERDDEARLRQLFATMRQVDARQAPPFRVPVATVPARWWARVPLPALAAAATLVLAVLVLWPASTDVDVDADAEVALFDWVAPTDSFLQLSGVSLTEVNDTEPTESEALWPELPTDGLFDTWEATLTEEQQL